MTDDRNDGATVRRWIRNIAPWALVAILVWSFGSHLQQSALTSGDPAPPLALTMVDGESFELASAGGITILNFWESWCPPCRAEAPVLQRAHESLQGRGRVIGLAMDRRSIPAAPRLGMHYAQAIVEPEVSARFGVTMLPTTVVVRADGTIARTFVGGVTDDDLDEAIDEATP